MKMPLIGFKEKRASSTFRAQPLAIAAVLLIALHVVHGQKEPDRSSPRATFASFLENMVAYGKNPSGETGRQYLELATSCLDLSSVPSGLRPDVGPDLARDLKNFLDKFDIVVIDEVPEKWDSNYYLWRKPIADGEISLVRDSMGTWKFSTATIESLPALLDFVKGKNVVEGVEATIQPETFADWLREKLPPSLTDRAILLENWQWLALLIIVFIGLIIERVVDIILSYWIGKLLMKTRTKVTFKVESHVIRPAGFLVMAVFWSLMLPVLDLPLRALEALLFATQIIMAASGVWAAYRVVDIGAAYFGSLAEKTESKFDDLLVPMVRRSLKILVGAFGLLFVADNMDIDITSLLAGLGIGGVALALAAKDTVENLFGSVTVLIDRPFEIGDWIRVGDLEGTVEDVGFRSTRIRTFYNSVVSMPNRLLVNTSVDNMGRRKYRRIRAMLGVQYDTPPEKIDAFCEGIREIVRRHPYTRKDFYLVYLNEFADFSLNILLYVFHETPDWATELRERHRLFLDIVRLAQRLGVEFAFPTQTLHVASIPPSLESRTETKDEPPGESPASPGTIADFHDAIRIGRAEAEAIVKGTWGEGIQPPVSFDQPESLQVREGGFEK